MNQLINHDLVVLDVAPGPDKEAVIRSLVGLVAATGRSTDQAQLERDVLAREATSPTGLKGGIAIPHCRTTGVSEPTLVFARLNPSVDFGAKDGPADLAFLIAVPDGGDADHLTILTKLARALVKKEFAAELRTATSVGEVVTLVQGVLDPAPAPAEAAGAPAAAPATQRSLVAVTACPTGIAHTYLAAEALQAAAERAGVRIDVETQGSAGSTPLPGSTIAAASAVILATDVGVRDKGRFAGLPVVASGVKRAVDDADAMIAEALRYADDPAAPRVTGAAGTEETQSGNESWGARTRRILMTGVSYMIPFVAAGGLLIALSFLFGGYQIALPIGADGSGDGVAHDIVTHFSLTTLPDASSYVLKGGVHLPHGDLLSYLGAVLLTLGGASFGFLVPALSGYIAFAIADRPGIAPGFVMGAISGVIGAGFLGGIVGGVIAGLAAHWIAGRKVPTWARGLMPVLVIPLGATLAAGLVMLVVLAGPLGSLTNGLNDGLNSLKGGSAILLGVILGLMMAFDMGGPLNKVAYSFATAGLGVAATASDAPQLKVMAAVMLAGMVPPIALALATVLRPGLFTTGERENGKAAWLMGASFITEGAIPFAAADPLRVIPSVMVGSAVTGGLSEAFGVSLRAPHGGIFVLFAVDGILGFVIALAAGVAAAAACVIVLKSLRSSTAQPADEQVAVPA